MQQLSLVRRSNTSPEIILAKLQSKHKEVAEFSLSLMNINKKLLQLSPSSSVAPPSITQKALALWKKLFKDPSITNKMRGLSTTDQWLIALRAFMTRCHRYNILPFTTPAVSPAANNSDIYKYLAQARRKLVEFIDTIKLFDHFSFYRIKRQFTRTDTHLIVQISCVMRKVNVPELTSLLCNKTIGFTKHGNKIYKFSVDHTSELLIDLTKLTMIYTLKVDTPNTKTQLTKPLTEKQFEAFIKKDIWFPIIREIKFSTLPDVNSL